MRDTPQKPGGEAGHAQPSEIDDSGPPADGRQVTRILVAEWTRWLPAGKLGEDGLDYVLCRFLGYGRHPRERFSVAVLGGRGIADDEDLPMPREGKIGCDYHWAGAVLIRLEPRRRRRGCHPGGPDDRLCLDPHWADGHSLRVARGYRVAEPYLDAKPLERGFRVRGEFFRE